MINTFTHDGAEFVAEIVPDDAMGPPWKEHDGHGIVSEWTRRAKRPGERVLAAIAGQSLFYDFAATVKKARAENWGADGRTPRERAHRAALADFDYLRRFADNDWYWVGVIVRKANACKCCGPCASLWGIGSDAGDSYFEEIARELAEEVNHA